jgi:hypothetical protein
MIEYNVGDTSGWQADDSVFKNKFKFIIFFFLMKFETKIL